MQKQKILKEKENKILKDRAQDDSEDDQSLDKLDTLVKPSKPKLVKSKSKLYQGEKSVYDVYRTSLAQKYYKDILSNYNNTDLGTSSLFEGKSKDKKDLDRSRDRKFKLNVVGAEKAEEDGDEDEMTSGQKGGTFSKSKKKSVSPGKSAKQINEDSNNKRRLIPCKVEDRRNPDSHGPGGSRSKSRKKYSETSGKKSYHQYMLDRQKKSMSKSNKLEEEKAKSKSVKKTGNNTAQKSSQKPVANADEQNVKREKDFGITVSEFKHVNPKTTSPQKSGKFKETSDLNKIVFKELKDVEEDSKAKDAKGGSKGRNASKSNDRSKSRGKASNTPDREGSKNFSDLSEIKADYSYDGESRNGSDREILKGNQKNISYEKGSGDDNSDYLLDQNSASKGDVDQEEEDSLIHITDPKKRENIRAYRLAKKLALEDQSKMNGSPSLT